MIKRAIAALIVLIITLLSTAFAEEDMVRYILCNPSITNHVAVRRSPKRKSEEIGRLDCGDMIYTDGKTKNNYLHIYGITEYGEGWVHLGYIVNDAPIIERCNGYIAGNGRVKARRYIGGRRNYWLKLGDDVKIYARSEEWAVTNKGFVKMEYLDIWYGE